MSLSRYNEKRNFSQTAEPEGKEKSSKDLLRFVIQKHDASSLHYDFRLEMGGVLKSWAVPKGPSMNTEDKRLAMMVEDHPYDYRNFEGIIPEGNYGAGTVIVWDEGTYEVPDSQNISKKEIEKKLLKNLEKGSLDLLMKGDKVKGLFRLFQLKNDKDGKAWLLIKRTDSFASKKDITKENKSIKSGKTLAQVAEENDTVLNHPGEGKTKKAKDTAAAPKKVKASEPKSATKKPAKKAGSKKIPTTYTSSLQLSLEEGKDQTITLDKHQLKLTNLTKTYWPKEKKLKLDLVNYYLAIAPFMLPYMMDRPQSLNRHPNGINGPNFYQKNMEGKVPDWMTTHEDFSESTGKHVQYLVCKSEAALVYMANLGCIEMHPWHSRIQDWQKPDWCLIDLDPQGISFDKVIECAQVVKKILDAIGAVGYPKTSGSTGIHIYIPLGAQYNYDQSKQLAELIVTLVHQEIPTYTSLERSPEKRKRKIYLDFLQNRETQTAAAPYSLRPKPGVPVSTPVHWDEVAKGLTPTTYNMNNIFERLKAEGDLFQPVLGKGIDLNKVLEKVQALISKK